MFSRSLLGQEIREALRKEHVPFKWKSREITSTVPLIHKYIRLKVFRNLRCPGLYKNLVPCRISLDRTVSSPTIAPLHHKSKTGIGFKFIWDLCFSLTKINKFKGSVREK